MPIYAYRCEACGFAKDVLQKVSDPQLTVCLSCGEPTFKKQVTAAGFQLKGTGWYATDFRNGAGTKVPPVADAKDDAKGNGSADGKADAKPAGDKAAPAGDNAASTTTPKPAPAATPAAGAGSGSSNGGSSGTSAA